MLGGKGYRQRLPGWSAKSTNFTLKIDLAVTERRDRGSP
jgi:hypothetical protein